METSTRQLRIGSKQAEWVEWALDPMYDFWCTECEAHARGGDVYSEDVLPVLHKEAPAILVVGHCPRHIVEDLIYRLGEQAPDIAEQEGDDVRPPIRVAERLEALVAGGSFNDN